MNIFLPINFMLIGSTYIYNSLDMDMLRTRSRGLCLIISLFTVFQLSANSKPINKNQSLIVSNSAASKALGCGKFEAWFPSDIKKSTSFQTTELAIKEHQLIKNSTIFCDVLTSPITTEPATIYLKERGLLDGVNVVINHNIGNATIAEGKVFDNKGWEVACKRDELNDEKNCYARQYGLTIDKKKGSYFIFIGNDLTPGGTVELRVDGDKSISSFDGNGMLQKSDSDAFLKRVNKNSKVIVRYSTLSKSSPEVRTIDTKTMGVAIKALNLLESSIK